MLRVARAQRTPRARSRDARPRAAAPAARPRQPTPTLTGRFLFLFLCVPPPACASPLSASRARSILLVQEPGAKLRSVADDLYMRALDGALDGVLRQLGADATGLNLAPEASASAARAEAEQQQQQRLYAGMALVPAPVMASSRPPAASAALLRAVLLEAEEDATS
jgi:hypothetical protein